MMRTSFVAGNDTMFTSPNAALRFVPRHDKHVSFEIPMLATGGHLSGIQNTNQLKTYIKNLLRNGQTGKSIRDLLSTIDGGELAPIWDRKSAVYFANLQSLNEYITSGLDSAKYFETIQKIKPVQESYINLNAFAEVLLDEYKNDISKSQLLSSLKSFLRRLKWTERLEVNPQQEPLKMIDTNGCLLYTSPSPRDKRQSRMPSSA